MLDGVNYVDINSEFDGQFSIFNGIEEFSQIFPSIPLVSGMKAMMASRFFATADMQIGLLITDHFLGLEERNPNYC